MKRFTANFMITGIMASAGFMAMVTTVPAKAADDPIVRADKAVVQALDKGDHASANKLLDADFTWIDPDGVMRVKEDAFRAKLKPLVPVADDVKYVEHNYGNVIWLQESQGNNYVAHFWVKRPGGWRLLHATEITPHKRDFKPYQAPYDINSPNPSKEVPYTPITANEKSALDEWQEQESSQANWEKHVADNMDQRVVSTYGGPSPSKADRIAGMNKRKEANPNRPTEGAAPALWIRTWDFGTAVVMLACQPTYGDQAYWSSRVLAPNKDGLWQMMESYHNYIKASGVMTEVQGE